MIKSANHFPNKMRKNMTSLLIYHAHLLITMDDARRNIPDGALFVRDNSIEWIGPTNELSSNHLAADRIIDAADQIVLPGLINTHHHLYQTLTRAMAPNAALFDWLTTLYPIWGNMDAGAIYTSALVGMAELILSGCTTSSDHLYLYPNDAKLDDTIRAAQQIGLRFHAARGSMSLGQSKGGLPPDHVVEEEEDILKDCGRLIEQFHDPNLNGMVRLVLAPCSPFSVSPDLMIETAKLAREYDVQLHTHIAETKR
jgi:8-oxoguanine deaminase